MLTGRQKEFKSGKAEPHSIGGNGVQLGMKVVALLSIAYRIRSLSLVGLSIYRKLSIKYIQAMQELLRLTPRKE